MFENFAREISAIEQEIIRKGLVLNLDWDNHLEVQQLAREALACHDAHELLPASGAAYDSKTQAKMEIMGLIQLMLTVMRESANEGLLAHGGPVWRTLARALWNEHKKSEFSPNQFTPKL